MFEFGIHDWFAAITSAAAVGIFIILLIYDGYCDYREEERRRQRRARRGKAHE